MSKSLLESAANFSTAKLPRNKCGDCGARRVLFSPDLKKFDLPEDLHGSDLCAECLMKHVARFKSTPGGTQKVKKPKPAAKNRADEMRKKVADLPSLGSIVWWTIHESEISRNDLEMILLDTLGVDFLPREPQKKRAIKLALEELEESGLIRKIRDDGVLTAYQLVHEHKDVAKLEIEFEKKNLIVWDKKDQKLDIRMKYRAEEIRDLFDKYSEVYTSKDFRSIAIRFIKDKGGLTMRESGGVYFLPGEDQVDQLESFIEAIESEFYQYPVLDSMSARVQLFNQVRGEMERDLELTAERVKEMIASDKTRESTFVAQIESFKDLRGKCSIYSDLLEADAEVLRGKIDELQADVQKALEEGIEKYPEDVRQFPIGSRVEYSGRQVKKFGRFGKVVGYFIDEGRGRCKVLMDESQRVERAAPSTLTLLD